MSLICIFQDAMDDTFQFTNIYPEYKNNKMWLAIEVYVREKVLKSFKEAHIYIMLAFRPNKSGIVAYPVSCFLNLIINLQNHWHLLHKVATFRQPFTLDVR